MKNLRILTLMILAIIGFNSCQVDDNIEFIAQEPEEFNFSNSFLDEYILSTSTGGNLGERFTWDNINFNAPTVVNYEVQRSIIGDFTDMEIVGTTTGNEYAVLVSDLLLIANEAGLDNDPSTPQPVSGNVSFRVSASVGTVDGPTTLSAVQMLTLTLLEETGGAPSCDLDQLWAVGGGLPDAGWGWTTPVAFPCTGNGVYSWNTNFLNSEAFRFFTTEGDWASGLNYPHYISEGYTIDSNFEDALDGDNNFKFTGITGFYSLEIDTVNKTITLTDPQPTGICDLDQVWAVGAGLSDAGWGWTTPVQILCTGDNVYSANVNLINDAFRMFTIEGDWATGLNFPYYISEGYTIDANFEDALDGDNNFSFIGTPGAYLLTIDTSAKTITLN